MSIEQYNHKIEAGIDQPGSEWSPEGEDCIVFEKHTSTMGDLLSDKHYDVFVRYGYAEALMKDKKSEDYLFWKEIYDKMQTARVGQPKRAEFDGLIRSFQKIGFDERFPIPVDEDYELLDGSHRLACAALFNADPKVVVHSSASHSYDESWFVGAGFSESELARINDVRDRLNSKYKELGEDYHVGIVWGMALEHWEEVIGMLKDVGLRRAFIRDFGGNIEGFIHDAYLGDGMANENITKKAQNLSGFSTKAGIIVVDSSHKISDVKKEIREKVSKMIKDYFYDCIIHVIDTKKEGREILRKYDVKKNG